LAIGWQGSFGLVKAEALVAIDECTVY